MLTALTLTHIVLVAPNGVALAGTGIAKSVCPDLPVPLALDIALTQAIVELPVLLVLPLQRPFLAQGRAASLDVPGPLLLQVGGHSSAA